MDANTAAKEVISLMENYNLTREDWDSVMEIGKWGNESDITKRIPSKVRDVETLFLESILFTDFIYPSFLFGRGIR